MLKIEHKILNKVELKRCSVCKDWLPLDVFYKNKTAWDGLSCQCHSCRKACGRAYHKANKEKNNKKSCLWYKANTERAKELARLRQKANPEKSREGIRRWRKNNPEMAKEAQKKSDAKRRSTLKGRLTINIRSAVNRCLKDSKNGHTFEILGYSVVQLKKRLTKTMPQGYCWEDYLAGKLHIDHKAPVSAYNFKLAEDIDFRRCWALKNLQLLPASDNMSKNNRIDRPFQPSFIFG